MCVTYHFYFCVHKMHNRINRILNISFSLEKLYEWWWGVVCELLSCKWIINFDALVRFVCS
jgi:hypothetical protein